MALFEYNLFLVRAAEGRRLAAELEASGSLVPDGAESATVLGTLHCLVRDFPLGPGPESGSALRLAFFEHELEPLLQGQAQRFVEWLWTVCTEHRLDYAFMGGGLAYEGYEAAERVTDRRVMEQLNEVLNHGVIEFPHPLMLFSESLADGRPCRQAARAPHYRVVARPGVGCLCLLTYDDPAADSVEILQPGMIYGMLVEHFRADAA